MKLPNFRRINEKDYTKFGDQVVNFISQLAVSMNSGFEVVYEAFNKKITLRDNISATVKDITVELNSNGTPKLPTQFSLDLPTRVDALLVGRAENITNSSVYPSSGVIISWEQTQTGILISNITGLQANNQYRLRIVAFQQ